MASTDIYYGASEQAKLLSIVDAYIASVCTELEKRQILDFPLYDNIFKNSVVNTQEVARAIANYEHERALDVSTMNDLTIKKTQSRIFLFKAQRNLGEITTKDFSRDVNFYLSRIADLEISIRLRIDHSDKAVTSLRSIQSSGRGQ